MGISYFLHGLALKRRSAYRLHWLVVFQWSNAVLVDYRHIAMAECMLRCSGSSGFPQRQQLRILGTCMFMMPWERFVSLEMAVRRLMRSDC